MKYLHVIEHAREWATPSPGEKGAAMSVTHANGSVTEDRKVLGDSIGELSATTKDVAKRRPVPLVTAAAAAVLGTAAAVATVVRRRKAKQTPKQRAVNAWRRTTKSVRKRVKR
jgi:hypothetical protein